MSLFFTLLTVCLFSAPDVSASVPVVGDQSSYQTAFLYFLPDYKPEEVDKAEVRGCRKIGYTVTRKDCAAPRILKDKCPIGNVYKECYCAGSPTCSGSSSSSNPYSSSTGASMTSCVDCPGNTLYTWTCSGCSSYSLSSCPSHGNCSKCCNGKYKLDSCSSGYHVSGSSCEEDCNSSSYNWCPVHRSCHTNCCTDGTIKPCDTRCGGSGCNPCDDITCPSGQYCSGGTCVNSCTPLSNETGCSYGTYSCSDGCGGTRTCCSSAPSDPCDGVSCPSGQTCSNGTCISTCVSGGSSSCSGQTSSCSSSQVQTSSCMDCGGTTHYTCREKTCSEQGKKDCNGSCISTSSCCSDSDCGSGKYCSGGSCITSDPCASVTCTGGKTCSGGSCVCPSGTKDCNGSCISSSECCGGCPSGKSCSNGTCVCSLPTCTSSVSSKPANSSYTTSSCTDCSGSHTINTGWTCNSGYTQSGSSCVERCAANPCASGCYTNISCTYGCKATNSCGGCTSCVTYEEDVCMGATGSYDCDYECISLGHPDCTKYGSGWSASGSCCCPPGANEYTRPNPCDCCMNGM